MIFIATDILDPYKRDILSQDSYNTLIDFLVEKFPDGFKRPTDISVNGHEVALADYDIKLKEDDVIVLIDRAALPVGLIGGWFVTALANLAISVTLSYVANKLFAPDAPQEQGTPSPVYNLNSAQNTARYGSPIPIIYGKVRMYPSMIAQPFYRFEDNVEYLYHTLCVGQGTNTTDKILIAEDEITSAGDLQWKLLYQSDFYNIPLKGFGYHITNTLETPSNMKLINDTANPEAGESEKYRISKDASQVEIDYIYPNGLSWVKGDGSYTETYTAFTYRIYTLSGTTYTQVSSGVVDTNAYSIDAIQKTYVISTSAYTQDVYISFEKTYGANDSRTTNDTYIKRVKEIFPNEDFTQLYGDITVLVCKIKATNAVSSAGQLKVNGYFTRTDVGNTMSEVLTDIYTNTTYGGGLSVSDLSFPTTTEMVNCAYDSNVTVFDAMRRPAIAQGYSLYLAGMDVILKKDGVNNITSGMYNEMNILRNSFKAQYLFKEEYPANDGFKCTYIDGDGWIQKSVTYPSTSSRPQVVDLFGVVNYGISATETTGESLSVLSEKPLTGVFDVKVNGSHAFAVSFSNDGVYALDISDPTNMVIVDSIVSGTILNGCRAIHIFNNVAFVLPEYSDNFISIDISDPTNMVILDEFKPGTSFLDYAQYFVLSDDGTKAYIVMTGSWLPSIAVIDISNPSNMSAITYINSSTTYSHHGICVVGEYAYLPCSTLNAISIINLTTQAEVGYLTSSLLDGARFIEVKDNVAYVSAHDIDRLVAIDVSNPSNPTIIGSISSTKLNQIWRFQIVGDLIFTSSLDNTYLTVVIDISEPTNMTEINFLNTPYSNAYGLHVVGCKAYFAGNTYSRLFAVDVGCIQLSFDSKPADMAKYLYKQDQSRRKIVTFQTDIQGLIPQFLDKIMVSHSSLQWGEAGEVYARSGDNITISDALEDFAGSKTIVFRDIDGSVSAPYSVTITDATNITVTGMPAWVTTNTFYTIQEAGTAKEFLVIAVKPSGDTVQIDCVNYDETIYE